MSTSSENSSTSSNYFPTREEIRALVNQTDGIGETLARKLLKETEGLEGLENTHLDVITNIPKIGPVRARSLGIHDEDGNPVDTFIRNPCPVCGEPYKERHTYSYSSENSFTFDDTEDVCVKMSFGTGKRRFKAMLVVTEH